MTPALLSVLYVLLAVVALVGAAVLLTRAGKSRQRRVEETRSGAVESLVVEVPRGQDPAAVVAALQSEGIEAMSDPEDPLRVIVPTPDGAERSRGRVRAVIETAGTNIDPGAGPDDARARIVDEGDGRPGTSSPS